HRCQPRYRLQDKKSSGGAAGGAIKQRLRMPLLTPKHIQALTSVAAAAAAAEAAMKPALSGSQDLDGSTNSLSKVALVEQRENGAGDSSNGGKEGDAASGSGQKRANKREAAEMLGPDAAADQLAAATAKVRGKSKRVNKREAAEMLGADAADQLAAATARVRVSDDTEEDAAGGEKGKIEDKGGNEKIVETEKKIDGQQAASSSSVEQGDAEAGRSLAAVGGEGGQGDDNEVDGGNGTGKGCRGKPGRGKKGKAKAVTVGAGAGAAAGVKKDEANRVGAVDTQDSAESHAAESAGGGHEHEGAKDATTSSGRKGSGRSGRWGQKAGTVGEASGQAESTAALAAGNGEVASKTIKLLLPERNGGPGGQESAASATRDGCFKSEALRAAAAAAGGEEVIAEEAEGDVEVKIRRTDEDDDAAGDAGETREVVDVGAWAAAAPADRSPILMVLHVDAHEVSPEAICQLFGLYGDVLKVKLVASRGMALVQMRYAVQAINAQRLLDQTPLCGMVLEVKASSQWTINDPTATDFSACGEVHRYKSVPSPEDSLYRDGLCPPCSTLVIDNVSPDVSAEEITSIFVK
ncbi:unnamed protein product, partial [Sphacelaria rigidula]